MSGFHPHKLANVNETRMMADAFALAVYFSTIVTTISANFAGLIVSVSCDLVNY